MLVKGVADWLEQTICEELTVTALSDANTLTVTVRVLTHPLLDCTVSANVTVAAVVLELVKEPLIGPLPLIARELLIPEGLSLVQLIIDPVTKPEIVMGVMVLPLHTDCVKGVRVTCGLTVTLRSSGVAGQSLAVALILYTTVPSLVPVAVKSCCIDEPLLSVAPVAPV